jgi:DNA helicase II / ATP-dependent DNA helicase PcrA
MSRRQDSTTDPLRTLNHEQRRAVQHTEGPLLVLAGAGSGKTKMLVHRIAHLTRGCGVAPGRIAAVTFTNRAADEMRERVRAFAGDAAQQVVVSTFHSLCLRILREHAQLAGLPRRFAIYATADQLAALKAATAEISIADDRFDLKRILRSISDWKSRGIQPADAVSAVAATEGSGRRADDYAVLAADAYPRYEEVLRANGAVDFDDLLLLAVRLLDENEAVRREVWRRWHYVMIDEYQDTNAVQLRLARLIAGTRRNLCVVGDDDQSIYAFRGADVGNILAFERHFPGALVVKLEQNYRSTQRILAIANAVIAGNRHRHPKQLRTTNAVGAPVTRQAYEDEIAEAEDIVQEIATRRFAGRLRWRDVAILYRTNTQAKPLEEALRARGAPYRVVGGTSFFDRKEVADALAWLRAVGNPADEIAIRRIINVPARGIGRTTVLRIADEARARSIPFMDGIRATAAAGSGQSAALRGFIDILDDAAQDLAAAERAAASRPPADAQTPLAAWAADLLRRLRLEEDVRADPRNARSADARVDNIRDVPGTIERYERKVWADAPDPPHGPGEWQPPTLADALARLALADRDDERDEETGDRVTLMTLHSAKGLEFDEVYLVGLEEGILPHARSMPQEENGATAVADPLDEERRLLYVGLTRARNRLVLSACLNRRRGRERVPVLPSRFLEEIPDTLLEFRDAGAPLTPEESVDLRANFLSRMRDMLAPEEA